MYHDILVPCDGSPEAERAAGHAVELADRFDGTVHGLYVVESGSRHLGLARPSAGDGGERVRRGKRALEHVRERAAERDVPVETTVAEGDPASVIVDFAAEVGADHVVMGTHGRSGVERVLLGSVAEHVVRAAPVPVTTLGPADGEVAVSTADGARRVARERLREAGHEAAEVEDPSRQRRSWVVHARDGDAEYNVHINVASGRSRLARVK